MAFESIVVLASSAVDADRLNSVTFCDFLTSRLGLRRVRGGRERELDWVVLRLPNQQGPQSTEDPAPSTGLDDALEGADLVVILNHAESARIPFLEELFHRAQKRAPGGQAGVVLVYLEAPLLEPAQLVNAWILPGVGPALNEWPNRREALDDVADGIRNFLRIPPLDHRVSLFYSYSHADEGLRTELSKHLASLRRSGWIREWHDREILPGDPWPQLISLHLESADVILLLLSADFINSNYIWEVEYKRAMQRRAAHEARVVGVVLRPVTLEPLPIKYLQLLPKDAKPVTQWSDHDSAFRNVSEGILKLVQSMRTPASPTFPGDLAERILDAGIPGSVTVGKEVLIAVMIRRPSSPGLRSLVEVYGLHKEEISSSGSIQLEFPAGPDGNPAEMKLTVSIEAKGFEPQKQSKEVVLPPDGDSLPRLFSMTPRVEGDLLAILELSDDRHLLTSLVLKTHSGTQEAMRATQRIESVTLPLGPGPGSPPPPPPPPQSGPGSGPPRGGRHPTGAKQAAYAVNSRQAILRGADRLADAVKVTLGPKGRNVVLEKKFGGPNFTKDGITVAKEIDLKDPLENMGAQMVREVASKTSDMAGDGTTTATILARSIFRQGVQGGCRRRRRDGREAWHREGSESGHCGNQEALQAGFR